jgi:hypothetical protein
MVKQSEVPFIAIFTLECVIKILAMGFIMSEGCYLRDMWNWLDFIVVITGLLSVFPQVSNISAI